MSKKNEAALGKGGNNNTEQAHSNRRRLTRGESRIINCLREKPSFTFELEKKCFVRYSANFVKNLRNKGFNIKTDLVPYVRRDGTKTRVGVYTLISESLEG